MTRGLQQCKNDFAGGMCDLIVGNITLIITNTTKRVKLYCWFFVIKSLYKGVSW